MKAFFSALLDLFKQECACVLSKVHQLHHPHAAAEYVYIQSISEELVPKPSDSSSFLWGCVGAFNSACAFIAFIQPSYQLLFW